MRFTDNQKKNLRLALYYAIQWEESVLEAHSSCRKDDPMYISIYKKCCKNIREFQKLRKKIKDKL